MTEARKYFYLQCVAHARSLPLKEATVYLRGLIESSTDSEFTTRLEAVLVALSESDRQLELIRGGQLKLEFNSPRKGARKR